jgi:hypothetical protein
MATNTWDANLDPVGHLTHHGGNLGCNHATIAGSLDTGAVYRVFGLLAEVAMRMPQALEQLTYARSSAASPGSPSPLASSARDTDSMWRDTCGASNSSTSKSVCTTFVRCGCDAVAGRCFWGLIARTSWDHETRRPTPEAGGTFGLGGSSGPRLGLRG